MFSGEFSGEAVSVVMAEAVSEDGASAEGAEGSGVGGGASAASIFSGTLLPQAVIVMVHSKAITTYKCFCIVFSPMIRKLYDKSP